jgi:putative transcription antitermination factor YqgF
MNTSSILGIDWGATHIGLALADTKLCIPAPYKTLSRYPWHICLSELRTLCKERAIIEAVIGWPCGPNGQLTQRTGMISSAIDLLRRELGIPIHKEDERFSSNIARSIAVDCDSYKRMSARRKSGRLDHYAAAQILSEFLRNRNRNTIA